MLNNINEAKSYLALAELSNKFGSVDKSKLESEWCRICRLDPYKKDGRHRALAVLAAYFWFQSGTGLNTDERVEAVKNSLDEWYTALISLYNRIHKKQHEEKNDYFSNNRLVLDDNRFNFYYLICEVNQRGPLRESCVYEVPLRVVEYAADTYGKSAWSAVLLALIFHNAADYDKTAAGGISFVKADFTLWTRMTDRYGRTNFDDSGPVSISDGVLSVWGEMLWDDGEGNMVVFKDDGVFGLPKAMKACFSVLLSPKWSWEKFSPDQKISCLCGLSLSLDFKPLLLQQFRCSLSELKTNSKGKKQELCKKSTDGKFGELLTLTIILCASALSFETPPCDLLCDKLPQLIAEKLAFGAVELQYTDVNDFKSKAFKWYEKNESALFPDKRVTPEKFTQIWVERGFEVELAPKRITVTMKS